MVVHVHASHNRLKSFKHALPNVYLASFLGSVDTFIRSTEVQLLSPINYCRVVFLRCVFTARDIYA